MDNTLTKIIELLLIEELQNKRHEQSECFQRPITFEEFKAMQGLSFNEWKEFNSSNENVQTDNKDDKITSLEDDLRKVVKEVVEEIFEPYKELLTPKKVEIFKEVVREVPVEKIVEVETVVEVEKPVEIIKEKLVPMHEYLIYDPDTIEEMAQHIIELRKIRENVNKEIKYLLDGNKELQKELKKIRDEEIASLVDDEITSLEDEIDLPEIDDDEISNEVSEFFDFFNENEDSSQDAKQSEDIESDFSKAFKMLQNQEELAKEEKEKPVIKDIVEKPILENLLKSEQEDSQNIEDDFENRKMAMLRQEAIGIWNKEQKGIMRLSKVRREAFIKEYIDSKNNDSEHIVDTNIVSASQDADKNIEDEVDNKQ